MNKRIFREKEMFKTMVSICIALQTTPISEHDKVYRRDDTQRMITLFKHNTDFKKFYMQNYERAIEKAAKIIHNMKEQEKYIKSQS